MKILQINTALNRSAPGRIAEQIGEAVLANNWSCFFAYGKYGNSTSSTPISIGNSFNIYLHALGTRLTDRHGCFSRTSTKVFIKQLDKINPDLIHLHNIHGYYLNIEILFSYLSKRSIPVVWTLHDCWPFTGHCAYFDSVGCNKWKDLCFDCPNIKSYPKSWFLDNSKRNFILKKQAFNSLPNLTLVPVSKWLGNLLKESFLCQHDVQVIHNGVDLDVFYPRKGRSTIALKYSIDMSKPVLLGVAGVWEKRKGLNDFIELSSSIDSEYQIVLVGLSKRQISKLPLNIIGVERTESLDELAMLYSIASVFINPTYEDNFPTTNLEALACGTPVITYNTGGSPEAIDSTTGFVVDKGDIKGLLQKVNFIIQNGGKCNYLKSCRSRAEKYFNKDLCFSHYIELYKKILKI